MPIDVSDLAHILRAIGCTPADAVVRLAWNDQVLVKRVLDAGAQTIMLPFVQTVEETRQAVSFAKYPPEGLRGDYAAARPDFTVAQDMAAYAARFGMVAFVTRLRSLTEVEQFIKVGIPLVVSVSFKEHELEGAGYDTHGHLLTVIGFTEDGDVISNDPASHMVATASNSSLVIRNSRSRLFSA